MKIMGAKEKLTTFSTIYSYYLFNSFTIMNNTQRILQINVIHMTNNMFKKSWTIAGYFIVEWFNSTHL
jgi:hypothetical protein